MSIQTFLTLYVLAIPVFITFDLLWIGFIARDFYRGQLGDLLGEVNWVAAFIFYAVFLLGLTFFASYPAVVKGSLVTAMLLGGLFGFFTYATYDLTNLATLKSWPVTLTVVDIIWGAFLGALVAFCVVFIHNLFV